MKFSPQFPTATLSSCHDFDTCFPKLLGPMSESKCVDAIELAQVHTLEAAPRSLIPELCAVCEVPMRHCTAKQVCCVPIGCKKGRKRGCSGLPMKHRHIHVKAMTHLPCPPLLYPPPFGRKSRGGTTGGAQWGGPKFALKRGQTFFGGFAPIEKKSPQGREVQQGVWQGGMTWYTPVSFRGAHQ